MKMVSPQGEELEIPGAGRRSLEALGWSVVGGEPEAPKRRTSTRKKSSDDEE